MERDVNIGAQLPKKDVLFLILAIFTLTHALCNQGEIKARFCILHFFKSKGNQLDYYQEKMNMILYFGPNIYNLRN